MHLIVHTNTANKRTDYIGEVARITNGNVTYLHKDHLGSASSGTTSTGAIVWNEQYTFSHCRGLFHLQMIHWIICSAFADQFQSGETILNPAANDTSEAVEREFKFLIRGIKNSCRRPGRADGFTGHIKDKATGLQPLPGPSSFKIDSLDQFFGFANQLRSMQARYYDPALGRFLSIDPVGFMPSRPGQFNRYSYTYNDPVNFIDPDGKIAAGLKIEGQAVAGKGGKFSLEVSVDFKTGEIRASGSVGFRAGLRGKGNISGFVEPSLKRGNSLSAKGVVSVEGGVDIETPIGTGEIDSYAEFGAGTDVLVTPDLDALLDVSGNLGPVSVDENGRASVGIGGALGASAGIEYTIEGSFSIPDTVDAVINVVDSIKEKFE